VIAVETSGSSSTVRMVGLLMGDLAATRRRLEERKNRLGRA
jgi:hypothetical protein